MFRKTSADASRTATLVLALAISLLSIGFSQAAELTVVTSGAFTAAFQQLAPQYEHARKNKINLQTGPSMGTTQFAIPMRLQRGEKIDVLIMASPSLSDLIKQGKVKEGSKVDLVQSKIAMAVKAGAPKPDIRTLDAFANAVRNAKSIAFSDSASGVYLSTELFPKLGIWDQIKDKSKQIPADPVGEFVARGDAEIGFQQVSELLPVKGIEIVGELPPGAQRITIFAAGIPMAAPHPEEAKALIQWLTSPAAITVIKKTGLEPVKSR